MKKLLTCRLQYYVLFDIPALDSNEKGEQNLILDGAPWYVKDSNNEKKVTL